MKMQATQELSVEDPMALYSTASHLYGARQYEERESEA
jgi:hypothetical protein